MILTNCVGVRLASAGSILPDIILSWASDSLDRTPDFYIDVISLLVGDTIILEWSTSSSVNTDGSFVTQSGTISNTVDSIEFSALSLDYPNGAFPDGVFYFHAKQTRGLSYSYWSNIVTVTILVPNTSVTSLINTNYRNSYPLSLRTHTNRFQL
jgi:hypothetical protein